MVSGKDGVAHTLSAAGSRFGARYGGRRARGLGGALEGVREAERRVERSDGGRIGDLRHSAGYPNGRSPLEGGLGS